MNLVIRNQRIELNFHGREFLFKACGRQLLNLGRSGLLVREFAIADSERVVADYLAAAALLPEKEAQFLRKVAAAIKTKVSELAE